MHFSLFWITLGKKITKTCVPTSSHVLLFKILLIATVKSNYTWPLYKHLKIKCAYFILDKVCLQT